MQSENTLVREKLDVDDMSTLEVTQLRETIDVIRIKLEEHRHNQDAAVQQAVQRSADEIQQLKNTATSLRDELESQRLDYEALLQEKEKNNVDENLLLQQTIETLRENLERINGKQKSRK